MIEVRLNCEEVDVLLIAEGTYPFVKGGVAQWIFDIINNLPEYQFGVIFLGARKGLYDKYHYPIPENIAYLQIVYLFNEEIIEKESQFLKRTHSKALEKITHLHDTFKNSHGCPVGLTTSIEDIGKLLNNLEGFSYSNFLHSKKSWDFITKQYLAHSTDPSFIDYFWNIRNMHAPLWELEKVLEKAPLTRVVHTISTGYAGLLACMLHQRFQYPMMLSEHGIYTKERNIELLQSTMLINVDILISSRKIFSYQHQLWLKFFDSLARTCYHYAQIITSLFKVAQNQQIHSGADIQKSLVTPNGVDIQKFEKLRRTSFPVPKIICFVGRFVRIKDIKTFIRSVNIIRTKDPDIKAWIRMVGEGDSDYLQECKDYIHLLELESHIQFIYEGDMMTILEQTGLLILTSISEGMPLVILESLAAGVPVITTDVGACREIIEGRDDEDRALGSCGSVVPIADASLIAQEVVNLLNDTLAWRKAQQIGITRIERYYTQKQMIKTYKNLYEKVMLGWQE